MMVRFGWNSEYGRKKFDVELDEGDLLALMLEAGLSAECIPKLTTSQKYLLLKNEAELLSLYGALNASVVPEPEVPGAQQRVTWLQGNRLVIFNQVRVLFGVQPVEPAES
jgi:hypothetical protein